MAMGAGPLYTNAIMGQTLSPAERDSARKASSTILREDHIQIEESESVYRPDSFSIHHTCADQPPYSEPQDSEMMTQKSLLHIPPDNPSHDLALFLRLTGPTPPHRRPSRLEDEEGGGTARARSRRFLKLKRRRSSTPPILHERVDSATGDQGLVAPGRPGLVEQKVSLDGTKYLALKTEEDRKVVESRVSVLVVSNQDDSTESPIHRIPRKKIQSRPPTPAKPLANYITILDPSEHPEDEEHSPEIPRRPVSIPPTPTREPESSISVSYSFWSGTEKSTAQRALERREQTFPDHLSRMKQRASVSLPDVLQTVHPPSEAQLDALARRAEMRHPTPQRYASHPILSQPHPTVSAAASPQSVTESPRPPPRSPLTNQPRGTGPGQSLLPQADRKTTIKAVPSVMSLDEYKIGPPPIKPTVVTDCTGPIKRPRSRGKNPGAPYTPSRSRQEREQRVRERKLRDRPASSRNIDAAVHKTPPTPRQRLRKPRPHIHVPTSQHGLQTTRASSSASSNASWKKVTEYTRTTPVSAVPSEDAESTPDKSRKTLSSPTTSNTNTAERITLAPVMLVAEESPSPKLRPTSKPSRVVMKDGRTYAPRPRSASVPSILQRRIRQGIKTPSRPSTPIETPVVRHTPPPLPSPPPDCALPPLPPSADSTRSRRPKQPYPARTRKPVMARSPILDLIKPESIDDSVSSVRSRYQNWPIDATPPKEKPDIYARVEALERKNAQLLEKLQTMAAADANAKAQAEKPPPMSWETRIAKRNAATKLASMGSKATSGERYVTQ